MDVLIVILFSYLSGSIPFGLILTKIFGDQDIRNIGSGNIGATNVLRTGNKFLATLTLALDILKGYIPVIIAQQYFPGLIQLSCLLAFLGHVFPVWLKFKGGKGVATLVGMVLALFPTVFPFCLSVAALTIILTGYVSLASILASSSLPIFLFLLPPFLGMEPASLSLMIFSLLIPWFIIFTHRSNIQRLRSGKENRFEKAMIFQKK